MSEVIERLDAALRPEGAPDSAPAEGQWKAATMDDAAWASRRLNKVLSELERVKAWEEREVARVRLAAEQERERLRKDEEFFTGRILEFLMLERARGRKTKQLDLPGGTFRMRARQPRVDFEDETFMSWAEKSAPELLRTTVSVNKAAAKKALELVEDGFAALAGEVVPGVTWEPQTDSTSFSPKEEALEEVAP